MGHESTINEQMAESVIGDRLRKTFREIEARWKPFQLGGGLSLTGRLRPGLVAGRGSSPGRKRPLQARPRMAPSFWAFALAPVFLLRHWRLLPEKVRAQRAARRRPSWHKAAAYGIGG